MNYYSGNFGFFL